MKKIIAGNWKLYKNPSETRQFFKEFMAQVPAKSDREFVFFPPMTNLEATGEALRGQAISWGAQNCGPELKGAFTGETSAQVAKELGAKYILIGHSERRTLFSENDEMIAKKVELVQEIGLTPMLCIGETLAEREAGATVAVLRKQLEKDLSQASPEKPLVIAYEPVWAIGTGKVATTAQIQEAHLAIFEILKGIQFSAQVPLLYGGSVKPENAQEIGSVNHVHGFLVGGASLEVASFKKICEA